MARQSIEFDFLDVLCEQKTLGMYPVPLGQLLELAGAAPDALRRLKSLGPKAVAALGPRSRLFGQFPDNPVALREDLELLAAAPQTLEFALRLARTKTLHAHSAAVLAKKLFSQVRKPFQATVKEQIENATLPPTVAWISDTTPKLFLLEDLHARVLPAREHKEGEKSPVTSAILHREADFAEAFERAFAKLDHASGSRNFVSLVDLRRELAEFERTEFDQGLRRLRLARRFDLGAAEGRHGISAEMRAAGIEEGGSLLLYVMKRG